MSRQHIGRIGLINNGNTCYFNSCIQLISHSGFFIHKFFTVIKNNKQFEKLNDIEQNMFRFLLEKWVGKQKVYNPINMHKSVATVNPLLNIGAQNDSSEAMVYLLDLITHKPLQHIFQNNFNSIRQCMKCKNIFERIETFKIISLDMSPSIKDSLDIFCKTENMDGQVECEFCKTKQDFQRTYKVDSLAEDAFDDQCTGANPRYPLIAELKEVLIASYYGTNYADVIDAPAKEAKKVDKIDK